MTGEPSEKVRLIAVWGNGDADSEILVSKRHWERIRRGGKLSRWAWAGYEGTRFRVYWTIEDREVTVCSEEGGDSFLGGIDELLVFGWEEG